jgi:hypothetical protein
MLDTTASLQVETAKTMKIAVLHGEKRFIDHADESYWKIVRSGAGNPLACADYVRRQVRLQAVLRELIALQSGPQPSYES